MDPYQYLPFLSRRVMRAWAEREQPPEHVAWTPLDKPLNRCRVALISSAGISRRDDDPFDQQAERDDPWRGDSSWRTIPASATERDVVISHLHIDTRAAESDLDVVLPMRRLTELAADGVVGDSSPRHFSIMGYILDAADLTRVTAPQLAAALADDNVDLALLVPV
jgi:D-proline reductase (dithiol) PrdB